MGSRGRRRQKGASFSAWIFIAAVLVAIWGWMGNDVMIDSEVATDVSEARGTRVNGFLVNGKRLPVQGANFASYSRVLSSFGRTCVHGRVREVILDAYAEVYENEPKYTFVFGETGWCDGGGFWPHKTHQNGLSVDFMVPVKRKDRIVPTPTTVFDGFGYSNEFDEDGKMGEYEIDFEAMAVHLEALRTAAKKHGLAIERVIFDNAMHDELFATRLGKRLERKVEFVTKPVWVRHDDHYHVDFVLKHDQGKARKAPRAKKKASTKH